MSTKQHVYEIPILTNVDNHISNNPTLQQSYSVYKINPCAPAPPL